jgi:very-short-patch-repair endonuclease
VLERPIPTKYARSVHDVLLKEGYESRLEEPIKIGNPVRLYYADIWIPRVRLDIEIDGSQHDDELQRWDDEEREGIMREAGIELMRFSNQEVYNDLQAVVDTIIDRCNELRSYR